MRESYHLGIEGLTQELMLENMRGILGSHFLGRHVLERSDVQTNVLSFEMKHDDKMSHTRLGRARAPTLSQSAYVLGSLVDMIVNDEQAVVQSVAIDVEPTYEDKRARRMARPDKMEMPLHIRADFHGRDLPGTFSMSFYNNGINSSWYEEQGLSYDAQMKRINIWYDEVDATLRKVMLHLGSAQPAHE